MLNIPNDQLPEEWQNEERITVLYSPLRSRKVNSKDWDTKITSWQNIIYLYCLNNKFYTFTQADLLKKFIRNGRTPSCLNLIIEELIKTNELKYLDEYLKDNTSTTQTWTHWLTNVLIRKPLLWSVNSLITTNTNDNRTIIHYKVIQEDSQTLLNKIPKNKLNKLINLQQLFEIIGEDVGSSENVKLLLYNLKQQKKVDFTSIDNQSNELLNFLIKFGLNNQLKPITEIDISIYVLEQNEQSFVQCVEALEDEINRIIKDIKKRLSTGHRQLAKANLKKKHEIQKRLDRKLNALQNIQMLLEKLRDIHEDAQLWGSYKQALAAFNKTFKETGLSEDKVEDTILELEEVLEISNDIQNVLAKPVVNATSDEELEKELEELIKDERQINEDIDELGVELANLKLPEVPAANRKEETEELPPSQSS